LSRPQKIPLATNVGHSKPKDILREYLAPWVKRYRFVSRVIYANSYHFVIAVRRAKEAESGYTLGGRSERLSAKRKA
jgi:hypothetical protein